MICILQLFFIKGYRNLSIRFSITYVHGTVFLTFSITKTSYDKSEVQRFAKIFFYFYLAMVSCCRFIFITNSSDHRWVWIENLLHMKQWPNPIGHKPSKVRQIRRTQICYLSTGVTDLCWDILTSSQFSNHNSVVLKIYLGNYFVCIRFTIQTLLWPLEFEIQINLQHVTIAVWNLA